MKDVIEYQPIIDEFMQSEFVKPIVFRTPRRNPTQRTIADLRNLHLPDTTPLEAEWTDENGYHRVPIVEVWESEDGSAVMTVGAVTHEGRR